MHDHNRSLVHDVQVTPKVMSAEAFLRELYTKGSGVGLLPVVVVGTVRINVELIKLPVLIGGRDNPRLRTQSIRNVTFMGMVIVTGMKNPTRKHTLRLNFSQCSFRESVYFESNMLAGKFLLKVRDCEFMKMLRFWTCHLAGLEMLGCVVHLDIDFSGLDFEENGEAQIRDLKRGGIVWGDKGQTKAFDSLWRDPATRYTQGELGL